jgi:hypothetical protein
MTAIGDQFLAFRDKTVAISVTPNWKITQEIKGKMLWEEKDSWSLTLGIRWDLNSWESKQKSE